MRVAQIAVYVLVLTASACIGYWSMTPGLLSGVRNTPSGCLFAFVIIVTLCTLALWYARRRGAPFYFPSLRRGFPHPFLADPLQCLFIGTLVAMAIVLGSAIRLAGSGFYGLWTFLLNLTVFVSLLVAQALNYFLHRAIIEKA